MINFVEKRQVAIGSHSTHMQIINRFNFFAQFGELVKMRGKQSEALNLIDQIPIQKINNKIFKIIPI